MSTETLNLVLVHGWGGSRKSLMPLAAELESFAKSNGLTWNTEVLELPGFGETELNREFQLNDYSAWLREQLAAVQSKRAGEIVLIGHSVGGKIAMTLLSREQLPDVKSLILINASGLEPHNSLKRRIFRLITLPYKPVKWLLTSLGLDSIEAFLQKAFYKFIVRARDYEKLRDKPILKKTFQNIIATHLKPEQLHAISKPTLIIWGENDTVTPLWMGEILAKSIANAQLDTVEGTTHGLPLKEPQIVANLITEFILNKDAN
jgi:pimeloyl-ACP methyl ester carboxylesterase